MDPIYDPYNFTGMGTGSDPFNYYSAPGYSTQSAPTTYAPSGDLTLGENAPSGEQTTYPASYSQVPGTSGAPSETPSATPGGVSGGSAPASSPSM